MSILCEDTSKSCVLFLTGLHYFFLSFAALTRAVPAAAPWPCAALWSQRAAAPWSLPPCAPKLCHPPSLWELAVGLLGASWADRAWFASVSNDPPPEARVQSVTCLISNWQAASTNVFFPYQRQHVLQTLGKSGVWNTGGDSSGSGCSMAPWDRKVLTQTSSYVIRYVSITIFFSQIKEMFDTVKNFDKI